MNHYFRTAAFEFDSRALEFTKPKPREPPVISTTLFLKS
jgi:hypothetical protein